MRSQSGWVLQSILRKLLLAILIVSQQFSSAALVYALDEQSSANLVKAGFLLKFPLFVDWPNGSGPSANRRLVIEVIGNSPLYEPLKEVAKYTRIHGHTAIVRHVQDPKDIGDCQVLLIAHSEHFVLEEVLAHISQRAILTVADTPGYGRRGVHLNFFREGEHVRFEINEAAAKRSRLEIGFRLKEVGKILTQKDK